MAVTAVRPRGDGGWDLHLMALPAAGDTPPTGQPPDPTRNVDVGSLDDAELDQMFADVSAIPGVTPDALRGIADEMDRRDRAAADRADAERQATALRQEQQAAALAGVNALSDDELFDRFHELSSADDADPVVLERLIAEMDFREQNTPEELPNEVYAGLDPNDLTDEQRQLDDLLAQGHDYFDAYAEVYGGDASAYARQANAQATIDRRAGETLDQATRRAYDEYTNLQYLRAEDDTRGHMLNAEGQAAGIDPVELFSGPTSRARRYASEDLQRWWADNGRMTVGEFRAQTLGRETDIRAAERTRLQSNARDFI
jgi:hypothetical protein